MKIKKVISLLCTAAMLLAVPAGNVYAGAEDQSVVVTMPTTSEPESGFDPAYGWGAGEHVHEPLIQSTLVRTTKDLGIENDLATEYSCSDDGLTWTVKIRDDVKFTDGEPLTASDVAFTFNTCRDESSVNDFTMLKEAVAVDDTTVEFHMNEPYFNSNHMYSLALDPHASSSHAANGTVPDHSPLCRSAEKWRMETKMLSLHETVPAFAMPTARRMHFPPEGMSLHTDRG